MVDEDRPDWEELMEIYDGATLADGFEEALIGFGHQFAHPVAIYDLKKCYNILIMRDGMDDMEAMEYMDFNVLGAYVGESTPIFLGDFLPTGSDISEPKHAGESNPDRSHSDGVKPWLGL